MSALDEALATIRSMEAVLNARQPAIKRNDAYYRGDHPLLFASPEFEQATGGLFENFSDNWCGVVVDSVAERLSVTGFRLAGGETADAEAMELWQSNGLDADSGLAFVDTLVTARSFISVWADDEDGKAPQITFEHASQVIVGYEPGSRRKRKAALKRWADDTYQYATLYLPTHVLKFQRRAQTVDTGGMWTERTVGLPAGQSWEMPNPLGIVPVVEAQNRPRLVGEPQSEIDTVLPIQDAINTLWAHLLTASDYLAFPQRVILGMDRPTRDLVDEAGNVVGTEHVPLSKFRADRIAWLEDPEARIDAWAAASLDNYTSVIEVAVRHLAAQTRTPPHYLLGQMVNISAEALTAAESGLVAKVRERQTYAAEAIREAMRLAALVAGNKDRAEGFAKGTVLWRDPQFRAEAQYADALSKYKSIGVPDEALWERIPGVTPPEIERWKTMQAAQREADMAAFALKPVGGFGGDEEDGPGKPPANVDGG